LIRVIIPDSHGSEIDTAAAGAFLSDLKRLDPDEIVALGDHSDCSGWLSKHKRVAREDMEYSYAADIAATNEFWDAVEAAAPRSRVHVLEGNHDYHVERWAVQTLENKADAELVLGALAPSTLLRYRQRGWKFYRMFDKHDGLSIPGTIRLGECYFTHGISASKYATARHVETFGANVVHGHTHRAQEHRTKTIRSEAIGGWCPGTLAKLQPTYLHTSPSSWSHGYGAQFFSKRSGRFIHINVPIVNGVSLLGPLLDRMKAPA
jgi:UDP-2,3-diacylglucosamine pyrophosphatase LpxH